MAIRRGGLFFLGSLCALYAGHSAAQELNGAAVGETKKVATNGKDLSYQDVVYPVDSKNGLPDAFVRTSGTDFVIDGCGNFVFAGFNWWQALELATNTQVNRGNPNPGREHVAQMLNRASEAGLRVLRLWAHTIVEGRELQPSPGVYDEEIFQGLDYLLDQCLQRGLKLVLIIADNWYKIGGVDQFAEWGGGDFFSTEARELYKKHMEALALRVNSINGRVYKDDPTIMAWNLANELRCKGCGDAVIQGWLEEMCSHMKSVDPNHIIGAGIEGFYGQTSDQKDSNPAEWASNEGQNFIENNKIWCIDYVGMHVWPDNWNLVTTDFQQDFIRQGIKNAEEIGKPVVLEEFGKVREGGQRDEYFESAFEVVEESVETGGNLRGTIFYHWYDDGIGPGSYGVHYDEETFDSIKKNAALMDSLSDC